MTCFSVQVSHLYSFEIKHIFTDVIVYLKIIALFNRRSRYIAVDRVLWSTRENSERSDVILISISRGSIIYR